MIAPLMAPQPAVGAGVQLLPDGGGATFDADVLVGPAMNPSSDIDMLA